MPFFPLISFVVSLGACVRNVACWSLIVKLIAHSAITDYQESEKALEREGQALF